MLVGKERYKSCESHIGSCHSARIDRAKFFWQKHGSGSLRGSSLLSILRLFTRRGTRGRFEETFDLLYAKCASFAIQPCTFKS